MKKLFVCGTYMQVIIAIWAKLRMFAEDDVDIVLTDSSLNADKRAEGLKKIGIFRRVKYIETKRYSTSDKLRRIYESLCFLFGDGVYSGLLWDDDCYYDQLYFYNPGLEASSFADKIFQKSGKKRVPELIRFEEGILCYSWLTELSSCEA